MPKIKLPAKMENLQRLTQFVLQCAKGQGFDERKLHAIELATEEALVNIFRYAYPESGAGDVEVSCKMDNESKFIMEFADAGIPFEIDSIAEPDLDASLSERKVGGLGFFLIRKMVDDVQYRREGKMNFLTLTVRK